MSLFPEEISPQLQKTYTEGTKKEITVNAYERNLAARNECIKVIGYKCIICGFDFVESDGKKFLGKIHAHQIKPLYLIDKAYELNPITDLAPVCPNCHMILHVKENGVYTLEEVRGFIKQQKKY